MVEQNHAVGDVLLNPLTSHLAVAAFGYPAFFIATSCIGLPVAAICIAVWRTQARQAREDELPAPLETDKVAAI